MDNNDWRTQLVPALRQKIVDKITDTCKRSLPYSGPEGLNELNKLGVKFEEEIYNIASSQSDYLRRISLKMLVMETKSKNPIPANNWSQNLMINTNYSRSAPPSGQSAMDDWRAQVQPDARGRVVNIMVDALKRYLPVSGPVGPEGLKELRRIAGNFEERMFWGSSTRSDYIWGMAWKVKAMKIKSLNTTHVAAAGGSGSGVRNSPFPVLLPITMLPMPMPMLMPRPMPMPMPMPMPSDNGVGDDSVLQKEGHCETRKRRLHNEVQQEMKKLKQEVVDVNLSMDSIWSKLQVVEKELQALPKLAKEEQQGDEEEEEGDNILSATASKDTTPNAM